MITYNITGIYTIVSNIDNKIYIGRSINVGKRLSNHMKLLEKGKHPNIYLQNAWNKYKRENFKFELLLECNKEFLCSEENYWCNLLNSHNRQHGFNIEPTSPYGTITSSIETRKKQSIAHKGKVPWINGKRHTIESLDKMKMSRRLRKTSKETRSKMSISHTGKLPKNIELFKHSTLYRKRQPEELLKQSIRQKKNIIQYDKNMNYIRNWESAKDAVQHLGISDSSKLTRCARKADAKITAYGFIWRYKEDSVRFVEATK